MLNSYKKYLYRANIGLGDSKKIPKILSIGSNPEYRKTILEQTESNYAIGFSPMCVSRIGCMVKVPASSSRVAGSIPGHDNL